MLLALRAAPVESRTLNVAVVPDGSPVSADWNLHGVGVWGKEVGTTVGEVGVLVGVPEAVGVDAGVEVHIGASVGVAVGICVGVFVGATVAAGGGTTGVGEGPHENRSRPIILPVTAPTMSGPRFLVFITSLP